jgi:hypothetical protein
MTDPKEQSAVTRLRRYRELELSRARAVVANGSPHPPRAARATVSSRIPLAFALVIVVAAVALIPPFLGGGLPPGPTDPSSWRSATDGSAAASVASDAVPAPTRTAQSVFPESVAGQHVFSGAELPLHVDSAPDGDRFLAGGWLAINFAECATGCPSSTYVLSVDRPENGAHPISYPIELPAAMPSMLLGPVVVDVELKPVCLGSRCLRTMVVLHVAWTP